jgi:hyperosmotically inducible periplasmic protein
MNPNEKYEQQSTQSDNAGQSRETITRTVEGPKQMAPSTIAVIIVLAVLAAGALYYFVSNNNENQEANRQTALESSRMEAEAQAKRQAQTPTQQPPVIIQQPAQQAPVIIQQPTPAASTESKNIVDDSTIQDAATKRLSDDAEMDSVTVTVLNGKALIAGSVTSAVGKTKAEQIVRAVRGVKSVENKVTVSSN